MGIAAEDRGASLGLAPRNRERIVPFHDTKHPDVTRRPRLRIGDIVLTLIVIGWGCSRPDGLGRYPVEGVVTLDGKPLAQGLILFEPSPGSRSGTAVGTKIRTGTFAISAADGPVVGNYQVRIYASSGAQAPPRSKISTTAPRPMIDLIPQAYNTSTILSAKVTSDQANTYQFLLSSDGRPPPTP